MTLGILFFIVAILFVVMVHESGHFLVAKLFGFKATKFFVGFGPTVWSTTVGETEYGVKAIPAGGFVKIVGMNPYEEVPPEDLPRSYPNKPKWQRALLLVAGSATHWVVAFVILLVTALTIGLPTNRPSTEIEAIETAIVDRQTEERIPTPAQVAGLEPGDRIVGVGEPPEPASSWAEVRGYIRDHGGEEATFQIERDGATESVTVMLGTAIFDEDGGIVDYAPPGEPERAPGPGETAAGFLGVSPGRVFRSPGAAAAVGEAGRLTWSTTTQAFLLLDDIFRPVFNGELWETLTGERERDPGGPMSLIGIGRAAGENVERGEYINFVGLIVGITIIVGIMNLLPLPPLDGGHLAVLGYEAITGRTVDVRKLIPIAAAVISFFVLLFIAVLYLDLAQPVRTPL